ncbi:MAG: DMT family transporter [Candidatus Micrarchaeia archaeon]|jgi:drug/metabolite transporter (DMT)-like permease
MGMKIDGRLLALASMVLWSLSAPLTKLGVEPTSYISFSFWTAALAVILAFPLFLRENGFVMAQKHWRQLALLTLCSYVLFSLLFFLGMERLSGIQGSALLGTEIIFSLGLGVWAGKERLKAKSVAFALALVFGVALVVTNGVFGISQPVAMLVGISSLFFIQVGYYLAPDAIRECGPGTLLVPGMAALAVVSVPLGFAIGEQVGMPGAGLPAMLAFALLPVVISYMCFYGALKRIGIYKTTALVVPAPALALFFSALLLGEQITMVHLLGMALIVLSVWKITEMKKDE